MDVLGYACKIPVFDRNGGTRTEECWAQADDPLRG
eukprot:gene25945-biopygen12065